MLFLVGVVLGVSYVLFILYKMFDIKNIRFNEEYGSVCWGKVGDICLFIDKKKDFNILLMKIESLFLFG